MNNLKQQLDAIELNGKVLGSRMSEVSTALESICERLCSLAGKVAASTDTVNGKEITFRKVDGKWNVYYVRDGNECVPLIEATAPEKTVGLLAIPALIAALAEEQAYTEQEIGKALSVLSESAT